MTTTTVSSGHSSSGTVATGNSEIVLSGGTTNNLLINGGGSEFVSAGGTANASIVKGTETVSAGGTASSTVVSAAGVFKNSGTANGTTVSTGGLFIDLGTASGTSVGSGGSATISGYSISMTVVNSGSDTVASGGVTSNTNITGGTETVNSGGSTVSAFDGGTQTVYGVASATTVASNSIETIESGGSAISTVVSGGTLKVLSGGTATNTAISAGTEDVFGQASGDIIGSGGSLTLEAGGTDTGQTISGGTLDLMTDTSVVSGAITFAGSGGTLQIDSNVMPANVISGFALGDAIDLTAPTYDPTDTFSVSGNELTVSAGGSTYTLDIAGASSATFSLSQDNNTGIDVTLATPLQAGQTSSGGTVSAGQTLPVYGTTSNFTVGSGGSEQVEGGGVSDSTTVIGGGAIVVSSGGTANNTVLSNGSSTILSGAVAYQTNIAGGSEDNRGTTISTTVGSGGTETAESGATSYNTTVTSGGFADVFGTTNNEVIGAGGSSTVEAGGTAIDPTINGGLLDLASGSTVNGAINFTGSGGTLQIDGATMPTATISGYTTDDTIDLTGADFVSGGTATISGNTLTVTEGGTTDTLQLAGNYTGQYFHAASDGNGGTILTEDSNPACFCEGTQIQTPNGETAVERLSVGDLVIIETPDTLTKNGSCSAHSVKWIGWSRVDLKRHPNPDLVRPVRIRANAIADGVPRRDLLVSPDHALFIDEKLIPARLLRNGMTIHEDFSCNTVIYYHVELDSHHVLLANGMPAESYLDTGNRSSFQNGGLPTMLHPNFNGLSDHECREARSCAPLVTGATCVEPVWRTVAGRAEALGFRPLAVEMTNDPALHILAEGKKITPISCINGQYLFILPALRGPVRLVSHSIAPSTLYPWVEDRRSLGVMIRHIIVRDGIDYDVIGADDPRLVDGWWASESDGGAIWRWTSGNAAIPIEGGAMIEVLVGRTLSYTAPSNDTDQEQALRLLRA